MSRSADEAVSLRAPVGRQSDAAGITPAAELGRQLDLGKPVEPAEFSNASIRDSGKDRSREAVAGGSTQAPSPRAWADWLALGVFGSALLGFARLGLGLLAVKRLRARSCPVADPAVLEEVDLLRAELSCTRRIAVRESSELETPATLGWRRPLVLLPFDWRDWSRSELRAVLAHELAHVVRGDFLAGLIAQLCVALHFYHPLAHWLAKRLRLEQELAADAWGAAVSGGSPNYLMTLAHMALKREDRGLAGPARAFLPSRGTLVTRIEMLRNTQVFRFGVLPARARAATIGSLAFVGLAVAGLRGPASQAQSPLKAEGAQAASQNGVRGSSRAFDLSLVPAETKMLVTLKASA
jgi:hypothetical protein